MSLSMLLILVLLLANAVSYARMSGAHTQLKRLVEKLRGEIDDLELKVTNLQLDRWMNEWDQPGSSDGGGAR